MLENVKSRLESVWGSRPVLWARAQLPIVCLLVGGMLLIFIVRQCFQLESCGIKTQTGMALILLGLVVGALGIVRAEGAGWRKVCILLVPVALAVLARVCLLDHVGVDYSSFLCNWCRFFRDNGGFRAIARSVGDYNVPYLYYLALVSYIPVRDLYMIKLFSVLFDVLLAWGGLRLVRAVRGHKEGDAAPYAAFAALLLLPTPIINSAYWGQCDSVYAALILHAIALVLDGHSSLSVVSMGIAFSFKLQTVFVLPLWGVLWLNKQMKFRQLWIFPLTFFVTLLPARLLGRSMRSIMGIYMNQSTLYRRLTLNGPTVFQFWPYGAESQDTCADEIGICVAALLVLILLAAGFYMARRNRVLDAPAVLSIAVFFSLAVPYFLPHMHERYFFVADVLTVCIACFNLRHLHLAGAAQIVSLLGYRVWERTDFNYELIFNGIKHGMPLEAIVEGILVIYAAWWVAKEICRCCRDRAAEQSPFA